MAIKNIMVMLEMLVFFLTTAVFKGIYRAHFAPSKFKFLLKIGLNLKYFGSELLFKFNHRAFMDHF
jgi:hypothetical protein